jgi:hypothetical protein
MSNFTLYLGQTAIVSWNLESGGQSLLSLEHCRNDLAVLNETDPLSFELSAPMEGVQYTIQIGEMWISEFLPDGVNPDGMRLRGLHVWPEHVYLESARGLTPIRVFSRSRDGAGFSLRVEGSVFVLPSKLGEDAYEAMSSDLARLSKSLLSDLHGKSRRTYELRHARNLRHLHSKEEELQAIRKICPKIERTLISVSRNPSFTVEREQRTLRFNGQRPISVRALTRWASRAPQTRGLADGVRTVDWVKAESFDIPEHRFVKAFLLLLQSRARACASAARRHIEAIEKDRPFRDVSLSKERASLYQTQDLPMISRLESAIEDARTTTALVQGMLENPLLANVKAEFAPVRGGMFGRGPDYRELENLMIRHLRSHADWVEGDSFNNIGKLTSTVYEQWCYLKIVDAFRDAGVEMEDWNGSIDHTTRGRFTIDFSRGMRFEGAITPSLWLRVSYQPWIHNFDTARRMATSLFRGGGEGVSWSPDVVLELCTRHGGGWAPVYAVVFDSKYSRRIHDRQWSGTQKYLEIRATHNRRQICRQLWLMAPTSEEVKLRSLDPDVIFDHSGPGIQTDETVRFALSVIPSPGQEDQSFNELARGLIEFFKARFSVAENVRD